MKRWLPNLLGYQLVWTCAVAGAGRGCWWAGPLALAVFAGWHLYGSRERRADAMLMLGCAALGLVVDSGWIQLGWIRFESAQPWPGLAPAWIVAIWMAFGLTLNHSLALLQHHLRLAALLGLLAGPLAYHVAASAWHAAELAAGLLPTLGLGLAWALLTPALLRAAAVSTPQRRLGVVPAA